MGRIFWLLKHLYTLPWSPRGRKMRIEKLMRNTGEDREVCALIVYSRDAIRGIELSNEEGRDALRLWGLLEQGEITMPANRS